MRFFSNIESVRNGSDKYIPSFIGVGLYFLSFCVDCPLGFAETQLSAE